MVELPGVPEPWERVTDEIASRAAVRGLDLAAPVNLDRYHAAVDVAYAVETFGREGALGVVLGNTRALWRCFIDTLVAEPSRLESPDPLDTFVETVVEDAVHGLPFGVVLRFAHDPPERRVAMQRLADVAGLAPLAETYLNVHPTYGPWIGLRALVVVDIAGPTRSVPPPDPCSHCAEGCRAPFEAAMKKTPNPSAAADLRVNWLDWVRVRDACPVGRDFRYSDPQVRYHYLKDSEVLRREVERARSERSGAF